MNLSDVAELPTAGSALNHWFKVKDPKEGFESVIQNWTNGGSSHLLNSVPVADFKEFERWFKLMSRLKYGWFHLKLYQMFQDLSQRLI